MSEKIEGYCRDLKKAFDSLNKELIIKKVGSISTLDRMQMRTTYKKVNGKDIFADISKKLSGQLQELVRALFMEPIEYDAESLNLCIKDKESVIEILTTRPNWILLKIKKSFSEKFKSDLEERIKSETLGDIKKLILGLLKCVRSERKAPDASECEEKATDLFEAEAEDWNLNESSVFYDYLMKYSRSEIMLIARQFKRLAKKDLRQRIDEVFTGEIKNFLFSCLYCLISPSEYLARRINTALKGVSIDYRFLIRIFVTRSEVDLYLIQCYYKKIFGKEMADDIDVYIKGDCAKLMNEILENQ